MTATTPHRRMVSDQADELEEAGWARKAEAMRLVLRDATAYGQLLDAAEVAFGPATEAELVQGILDRLRRTTDDQA